MNARDASLTTGSTPAKTIRLAAMNLLARREHSFHELLQKLASKFSDTSQFPLDLIETELQRLADEFLQSDERFVEAFVRSKKNAGKGPLHIQQSLKQKGVASQLIDAELTMVHHDWFAQAESVYLKKFRDFPILSPQEKAKRIRFMQSRGFMNQHYLSLLDVN